MSYEGLPDLGDPAMFSRANAGDDTLFVVFYMGVIQNEGKTTEAGRPMFDDVECVRIMVPGDRNNVIDRPASQQDKARFAKQYAMFTQGRKEDDQVTGTRLTEWPFLTRGQCEEFRYLGLRTVEQLAEVNDAVCAKVPGLNQLKRNAAIWLDKSKGAAEAAKTAKQIDDQNKKLAHLQTVIDEQAARLEKLLMASTKA